MKCKDNIRSTSAFQYLMRTRLPFDPPSYLFQCREQTFRLDAFPVAHAIEKENINAGTTSPFSKRSATTRKANA
jgi:hypothetical protein